MKRRNFHKTEANKKSFLNHNFTRSRYWGNKAAIQKWYKKQLIKDDLEIPYISPAMIDRMVKKTSGIRPSIIKEIKKGLTCAIGEAKLIKIETLLCRNICFWNCRKMDTILNQKSKRYSKMLGYNICACPCGQAQITCGS